MLRHFAYGYRDFRKLPDIAAVRYNWIIMISFDGKLHPRLDPPKKGQPTVEKANLFVIPPQTRYVLIPATPRCYRAVFHFAYVGEILQAEVAKFGIFRKHLNEDELQEAKRIADLVEGPFRSPDVMSVLYFESALLRLTILALQGLHFQPLNPLQNVPRDRVKKAIDWYSGHLQTSPSLSDVADNVHISVTQLRRHFYDNMGRSPRAVFSELRMQRATQLLIGTSLTLDQIGEQCGFQSATDFCRAFKKVFNVTPNHWRHDVNASGQVDISALSQDLLPPSE
jgi:AraC family transcriptional regulator